MQGASVLRTPYLGPLTGLQLNLHPSAESTPYPTPISESHSFQSLQNGSFSHMGYTFTPPDNLPKQPDGHQQWMSFGVAPVPYQYAFSGSGQPLSASHQFSQPAHQTRHRHQLSSPERTYLPLPPPPPIRRNSEALTHHHARSLGSMTDLSSMHPVMSARPHTSISTSRDATKMGRSSLMPMSVPIKTSHLPVPGDYTETLLSQAYPSSPSQTVPIGPFYTKRAAPQHLTYQRPTHGYSASASNIGLTFSPISPPSLLSGGDLQYDYTNSSASCFSNLSIQPQSTLPMEMDRLPQHGHQSDLSSSLMDGWADMMPSMGATTPLQELNGGTYYNSQVYRSTHLLK
jgi:hypothetical protein